MVVNTNIATFTVNIIPISMLKYKNAGQKSAAIARKTIQFFVYSLKNVSFSQLLTHEAGLFANFRPESIRNRINILDYVNYDNHNTGNAIAVQHIPSQLFVFIVALEGVREPIKVNCFDRM